MNSRLLKRTLCTLLMSLLLVVLCACSVVIDPSDGNEDMPISITVQGKTVVTLGEFCYDDFVINVRMRSGETKKYALTENSFSEEDLAKINTVGVHTLKVTYKNLYTTMTLTVLDPAFGETSFESKTYVYDGTPKTLSVVGAPADATVTYDAPISYTDAGTYEVNATVKVEGLDPLKLSATLTIEKAVYDMSGVIFADKTVVYDGEPHSIDATNLPEGVSVTYSQNDLTEADTYEIFASFSGDTKNYQGIDDMKATLVINKATYDMPGVTFEDKTVTYDGTAHKIEITGTLPEGVSVSYLGNGATNANTYTVTARFVHENKNYNAIPDMTATLTIQKADYDLSSLAFSATTVTYDGKPHSITATGLPAGLSALFTNNSNTNAGTYQIGVSFSGDFANYNVPADQTVTLTIEKASYDMSAVRADGYVKTYDGAAQLVSGFVNLPAWITPTVHYTEQVAVGEHPFTVTFTHSNPNYEEITYELEGMLTIQPGASYNITYILGTPDSDKKTDMPSDAKKTYQEGVGLEKLPAPNSPHEFLGWYADEALTMRVDSISDTKAGDIKLYAKWGVFVVGNFDFTDKTVEKPTNTGTEGYLYFYEKGNLKFKSDEENGNSYMIMYPNGNTGGFKFYPRLKKLLTDYTDTYEISYEISLARVKNEETGELEDCVPLSYRFGVKTFEGTNDVTLLSISREGKVTFNGQVVGELKTTEFKTFRVVVDLGSHMAGYYDENGNCLYTMYNEMFDIGHLGLSEFNARDCLNAYHGAQANCAIAVDDVYVALGNRFERVTSDNSHKIDYVLPEGTTLPTNANTSYVEGGIGAGLPIIVPKTDYVVRWYDNPEFNGDYIETIPMDSTTDLTYYGQVEWSLYLLEVIVDGVTKETHNVSKNTTVESNGITLPSVSDKSGYTFIWLDNTKERIKKDTKFYGVYVAGDEENATALLTAYNAGNFSYSLTKAQEQGSVISTGSAVLYLETEVRKYITEKETTNLGYIEPLRNKIVEQLIFMVTEGAEPYFDLAPTWSYAIVSAVIALARRTNYIWDSLSPDVQERYEFLMECFAYICTLGTDDDNNYLTGPGLSGNYKKTWNPNYRLANVLPMVYVGEFFGGGEVGADKVDEMLLSFDFETTVAQMDAYGFTNAYDSWMEFNDEEFRLNEVKDEAGNIMRNEDGTQKKSQLPSEFMENGGIAHQSNGAYAGTGKGVKTEYTYYGYRICDLTGIVNQLFAFNYSLDDDSYGSVADQVAVTWVKETRFTALVKKYSTEKTLAAGTVLLAGTTFGADTSINDVFYKKDSKLTQTVVLTSETVIPAGSTVYYGYTLQQDTKIPTGTLLKKGTVFSKDTTINDIVYAAGKPTEADIKMASSVTIPKGTVFAAETKLGATATTAGVSYMFDGEPSPYAGMVGQMRELSLNDRSSADYCTHDFVLVVSSLAALKSLGVYDLRDQIDVRVLHSVETQSGTRYEELGEKVNILSGVWVGNQDYLYKIAAGWTSYASSSQKVASATTPNNIQFVLWEHYWSTEYVDATDGEADGKYDITDFQ